MEPQTHRYVHCAIEAGNLAEVIRLCWLDIKSVGVFCSGQILLLSRLMTYFDDEEGLALLREAARDRVRRDTHYQPPFNDYRDDLLYRLDIGIEEGRLLNEVAAFVNQTPPITRRMLYEKYSVFENKKAKLAADRLKSKELRTENYISESNFERTLYWVPGIESWKNEKFHLLRSEGGGLDAVIHLQELPKLKLRSSPTPSSQIPPKRRSRNSRVTKEGNPSSGSSWR
jgi:hypothetical protein